MKNSITNILVAIDNIKRHTVYSDAYRPNFTKLNIIDILMVPFVNYPASIKFFRDKFIQEFYKAYLDRENIEYISNNLYYCLIIGLINTMESKLIPKGLYFNDTTSISKPILIHKHKYDTEIKQTFIDNITNDDVLYSLNFHFNGKTRMELTNIKHLDYKDYLNKFYPTMNEYQKNLTREYDPGVDRAFFIITLHFCVLNMLLAENTLELSDHISLYNVEENLKPNNSSNKDRPIYLNLEDIYEKQQQQRFDPDRRKEIKRKDMEPMNQYYDVAPLYNKRIKPAYHNY